MSPATFLSRPPTLIPPQYLKLLFDTITRCVEADVPGDIIEIGVYKGGSLYRMAEYASSRHPDAFTDDRRLIGIDTFAGHPYHDDVLDPAHHRTGRFNDASFEAVCEAVSSFPFVAVLKGECDDVFASLPANQRICFAHVDVDIAESAMRCTRFLYNRLSPGGVLIYDEYEGYGQKSLIDTFFNDKPVRMTERSGLPTGNYGLVVQRIG